MEGDHARRNMGNLKGLREGPSRQQARDWRPQSYNHRELNYAHNLKELGSGFFLSDQEHSKSDTLILALSKNPSSSCPDF